MQGSAGYFWFSVWSLPGSGWSGFWPRRTPGWADCPVTFASSGEFSLLLPAGDVLAAEFGLEPHRVGRPLFHGEMMFSEPVWFSLLLVVVGFVAGAIASVSGF